MPRSKANHSERIALVFSAGIQEAALAQDKLRVDRERGLIHDVRLHFSASRNGYDYSRRSMEQIVELYKKTDISRDHGSNSVEKLFGCPKNLSLCEEDNGLAIRGDLKILEKNQDVLEKVFDIAEYEPHLLKFSHEIPADGYKIDNRQKRPLITEVTAVRRIALITGNGGVNNTLFESLKENKMEIKTTKELVEEYPVITKAFLQENREDILKECVCKQSGGTIEKLAEMQAELKKRDDKIAEMAAKIAEFDEAQQIEERKAEIRGFAKQAKRYCDDEIVELCLAYPPDEFGNKQVMKILEMQVELKEGDPELEPTKKKPEQEGGTGRSKAQQHTWLTKHSRTVNRVSGYMS